MSMIYVGTSGWSYDDWENVVYPSGAGGRFDRLRYLAELCDSIEINTSFYHIPSRRTVNSWLSRISDLPHFLFSAKLYKGLTHEREEETADKSLDQYVNSIEPIHSTGRLAAVLMQFPWSFKFTEDNMIWLERLVKKLAPITLAAEVRHTSWLNDEYLDFLKTHKIAFCNIDQPNIKTNITPTEIVTSPVSYLRFHGRNAAKWFTKGREDSDERYDYLYHPDELEVWIERIRRMAAGSQKVFAYMNNHVGGKGLANALELKSMLSGQKVKAPAQLVMAFPDLKKFTKPKAGDEGLLF